MKFRLVLAATLAFSLATCAEDAPAKQRHFALRYSVNVKDVPAGKDLRIWIPLAHSDAFQDVQVLSKEGDLKLRKSLDDVSGNLALYGESEGGKTRDYRFTIEYDVVRLERIDFQDGKLAQGAHPERSSQALLAGFLHADQRIPITGATAQAAADTTASAKSPVEKARAIYDYIGHNIRLDSTTSGCCQGDATNAFSSKQGDSNDLTAVFVSMARSQQIPARSEVGFALPSDKHSGELTTHYSWAEFYAAAMGWLPADPAASIQRPAEREYYFGSLDNNRVQFSVGRDLKLNPPQEGGPVDTFIRPYVEVEGKPYSKVSLDVSFRDAGTPGATTQKH
jgi:transglutaminase-like putative cysteine protease